MGTLLKQMKPKKKSLLLVHSQEEWERRLVRKPIRWVVAQTDPCIRTFNGTNFSRALGAVLTGVREKLRSGELTEHDTLEKHHTGSTPAAGPSGPSDWTKGAPPQR